MKLMKACLVAAGMIAIAGSLNAQRIKILEGDISPLKDEKSINTEFTYENMNVGKKSTEAEYISKKKDEYNKKEAGRGDRWEKDWLADRKDKYEPKFDELFTKSSEMVIKKDAKYTLIYKTTSIEPGYNVAVMRHNAETNAEVWIVETGSKKVIAKIAVDRALGRTFWGADYETGGRIAECYADAGKALGAFIRKKS